LTAHAANGNDSGVTDVPLQLLVGPPGHGVVSYAADVARAVAARHPGAIVQAVSDAGAALAAASDAPAVHVHVTDRLYGRSPEEAAETVAALAAATRLTITLHDLPQPSDGSAFARRIAAYERFLRRASAAVVNSDHERLLVDEFLHDVPPVHVIPLGARAAAPWRPDHPGGRSQDLVVLIAGYLYPGKGHAAAIRAAAEAAERLRAAGEDVGRVVVRALGRPSPGHEADVDALRRDAAARGVVFDVTGFLADEEFAGSIRAAGTPLAAHEHISASRSMLDWVEAGRRPLVVDSRYAAEMDRLRPGTMTRYAPEHLVDRLVDAWRAPDSTWLPAGAALAPTLDDAASAYVAWWSAAVPA
jgi:glycosyltransferase involved in cell wall biosynthesis